MRDKIHLNRLAPAWLHGSLPRRILATASIEIDPRERVQADEVDEADEADEPDFMDRVVPKDPNRRRGP